MSPPPPTSPGEQLLHPLAIVTVLILLVNDHYWKGVGPPWVTGKLSDVAVMILVPLVFQAGMEWFAWARGRFRPQRSILLVGVLLAAGIMASINIWPPAAEAYRWGMAVLQWPAKACWQLVAGRSLPPLQPVSLVMDPADLWTIPFGVLPLWMDLKRTRAATASAQADP